MAGDIELGRRSPLDEEFFKKPEGFALGVVYEPYTQLETLGFSYDRVREAREGRELSDRVVVVVGVKEHGIGEAALIEAALEGAKVVGVSRQPADNEGPSKIMKRATELSGADALWIQVDITEERASRKIIDGTLEHFGRIDGLVLAVADIKDKPLASFTREELRSMFEVNFWGSLWILQDTLAVMERRQREGRIVLVSSLAGARTAGQPGYGPAKAGLENIIRSIPLEYIRYRGGIAGNAVASGYVAGTGLTSGIKNRQEERILKASLADRPMLAAEVAEAIAYFLNPNTQANGKVVPMVGRGPVPAIDDRRVTIRLDDRERFNFESFSNTPEYIKLCTDFVNGTLPVMDGAVILDLAAGTGIVTNPIREKYDNISSAIIGVDPNPVSLRKARERVVGDDKTKVGFVLGDGRRLPLPSESINFAYMGNAIHEIKGDDNKRKILEELHRVLTLDGIAYINSAFTEESYPNPRDEDLKDSSETRIWGWLKSYAIKKIPGATRNKAWGTFEVKKADEYKQMMEDAGFKASWRRQRVEFGVEAIEAISEYDEFIRGVFIDVRKEDGSEISLEEGSRALKAAAKELEREYKEKHGEDAKFIFPRYWIEFEARKTA